MRLLYVSVGVFDCIQTLAGISMHSSSLTINPFLKTISHTDEKEKKYKLNQDEELQCCKQNNVFQLQKS